jgi:hypothetical protein
MKVYKLTDKDGRTRNNTQWGENITHTAPGVGELCTAGWIHSYSDPLLAVMLNPIYGEFAEPRLWEAEASGAMKHDCGLKSGSASLTTLQEIPVPTVTTEQRVRFGILCALAVAINEAWETWAHEWLANQDRSRAVAKAAQAAAEAAWAAWVADGKKAREAAEAAAWAASWAARAAAAWAADGEKAMDLAALAHEAVKDEAEQK